MTTDRNMITLNAGRSEKAMVVIRPGNPLLYEQDPRSIKFRNKFMEAEYKCSLQTFTGICQRLDRHHTTR